MTDPGTRQRTSSRIAAVLTPAFVLLAAGAWFQAPPEATLTPAAARLDAILAETEPTVVILGNSTARLGVDTEIVRVALGADDVTVANLAVDHSTAPTWYAILKNRVFANGHRPRLVLLPTIHPLLATTGTAGNDLILTTQMGPVEPLILQKTFGADAGLPLLARAEHTRDRDRERLFTLLRNAGAGLLADEQASVATPGSNAVEAALSKVFSTEGALDLTQTRRMLPVVEEEEAADARTTLSDIRAGYTADLAELAREHAARLVVVLLPVPTDTSWRPPDAQHLHDLLSLLNEQGAGWLDLSHLEGFDDGHFIDRVHLNARGRERLSRALGERLREMNPLGTEPLPAAVLPFLPTRIERSGSPRSLPAAVATPVRGTTCRYTVPMPPDAPVGDDSLHRAGIAGFASPFQVQVDGQPLTHLREWQRLPDTCEGLFQPTGREIHFTPPVRPATDAPPRVTLSLSEDLPATTPDGRRLWWVYPGTTVQFTFDQAWDASRGSLVVRVTGRRFGHGPAPTVSVGDGPLVPLEGSAQQVQATVPSAAGIPPWTIAVRSPPDGPFLLLTSVALGEGPTASWAVGNPQDTLGASASLFKATREGLGKGVGIEDGAFSPAPGQVSVATRPGSLPLPDHDPLLPSSLMEAFDIRACDPIRLAIDGVPATDIVEVACQRLRRREPGGWCHRPGRLDFLPLATPGHTYSVGLEPRRLCKQGRVRWLYPGDHLRFQVPRSRLPLDADQVELKAHPIAGDGANRSLSVRVRAGTEVVLDTVVSLPETGDAITIPLPGRLSPQIEEVETELSTTADAPYVLILLAAITEGRPYEDLPEIGAAQHP